MSMNLTDMEVSAIGEVANISLGNAVTNLGILVRQDIDISIPSVLIKNRGDIVRDNNNESVITRVDYVKGIQGYSILCLGIDSVKSVADLMMGSDGYGTFFEQELNEIHLSAISEVMNQMMGAAATAMGIMLERMVDISPPNTVHMNEGEYIRIEFPNDDRFVQINFDVHVGNIMTIKMVQMYPFMLAKAIADLFLIKKSEEEKENLN